MSGLLRRLTRRRPATADENRSAATESSDPAAAPAETPAEPGGQSSASVWAGHARAAETAQSGESQPSSAAAPAEEPSTAAGEQPTNVLPATGDQPLPAWTVAATQPTAYAAQPAPPRDLPAGVDPGDLAAAPAASARRGKLRRRLRYLRHVRELLLRDLGGFTYEVHRTAGGTAQESHRRLAAAKAERISKLDEEVLALEARLGEPHAEMVLREPGIGGTCPECGELHASDAHFCSRCGAPLDEKARAQRAATAPPTAETQTTAEPQPASVLWAGGPRPVSEPAAEEEEAPQPPSEVTSQWLATDRPTTFSRAAQPEEPAAADEPVAADDEPAKADEPVAAADEPAKADEPVAATDEPAKADEPVAAGDEPAKADEPVAATEEPAKPDEPALDEPATAVEVPKGDEPAAPDATTAADEPAKPKRVTKPHKRAPRPKQSTESPSFDANGRRDDDVHPPVGDPIASPREQGS
jgi:hypothetical protein